MKKIRALQEEFEKDVQEKNMAQAWAKFERMLEEQKQMMNECHHDRLQRIEDNSLHDLKLIFHSDTLNKWPLAVLPHIMKGASIYPAEQQHDAKIPLHCLFAPSNDKNFNNEANGVYRDLEYNLCQHFNNYWGGYSSHPVLFYERAWENTDSPVIPANLKNQLTELPTLLIIPEIKEKGGIEFRVEIWGIPGFEKQEKIENFIPNDIKYPYQQMQGKYTLENKYDIVKELCPALQAFIGYIADLYYWAYDKVPPLLPSLLAKGAVAVGSGDLEEYKEQYLAMFNRYVVEKNEVNQLDILINPANRLGLLSGIKTVMSNEEVQFHLYKILLKTCEQRGCNYQSLTIDEIFLKDKIPLESQFIQECKNLYEPVIQSRIEINSIKNTIIMDSAIYQQKRDELIAIMGKILKIEGLGEKHTKEFQSIMKKSKENQFKITLVGEFQGGKSTTFNAFCDGREISPRGAMVKTSACKITATNISEKGKNEYAFVNWKSDSELIQSIEAIFELYITPEQLGYIPETTETKDKKKNRFEYSNYLSFSNPKHLQLMKDAIQKEWKRLDGVSNENDRLDILRIADVILHFYNNPFVKELKRETVFSIADVAKFAVFPEDWIPRLRAKDVSVFKAEEVVFAFVAGIDCYIHSKNLERLGCTIIDCPGLFTSKWDTRIAFETLPESDAILYLLGGEKQMTDGDKKALSEIKDKGISENKIFFAVNTRKGTNVTSNIVETDMGILTGELGFNSKTVINQYNAQLFFLAEFGANYLNGTADSYSIERFKKITSFMQEMNIKTPVEELWAIEVRDCIQKLKLKDEINELNKNTVQQVKELSKAGTLFDNIEKYIIENRAYSILIDTGAGQAKVGIDAIEEDLASKAKEATKSVMQCEEEIKNAQTALQEFQSQSRSILDKSFPDSVFRPMLNHGYRVVLEKNIEPICVKTAFKLSAVLKENKWSLVWLKTKSKEKQVEEISKIISPVIEPIIKEEVSKSLSVWITSINSGENADYKDYVITELERIKSEIDRKWKNIAERYEYIKSVKIGLPPNILNDVEIETPQNVDVDGSFVDEANGMIISGVIESFLRIIIGYVTGVITILVLDIFLFWGLAAIIGILVELLIMIGGGDERENVDSVDELTEKERKLYDQLRNAFNATVQKEETRSKVINSLKIIPNSIIKTYKTYYEEKFEEQENELNTKITNTRNSKKEAVEKQKQIADSATRKRENEIIPVSNALQSFIDSVIKQCKKDGK